MNIYNNIDTKVRGNHGLDSYFKFIILYYFNFPKHCLYIYIYDIYILYL